MYNRRQLMLLEVARAQLWELMDAIAENRARLAITATDLGFEGVDRLSEWLADLVGQTENLETKLLGLHDHFTLDIENIDELLNGTSRPESG